MNKAKVVYKSKFAVLYHARTISLVLNINTSVRPLVEVPHQQPVATLGDRIAQW